MADVYTLQKSTLDGLGDAMRKHFGTDNTFTPLEMIQTLNEDNNYVEIDMFDNSHTNPITGDWVRPNNWPDIDALADAIEGDQDCVYFTYDLTVQPDFHWIGMYVKLSLGDTWYLDRYDEGEFVHTHLSAASEQHIRYDLTEEPDDSNVQIWRLTSNGHIDYVGFSADSDHKYQNNYQPCVDRSGTLPWYKTYEPTFGTANQTCSTTIWLEHDGMVFGKNVVITTLRGQWRGGNRLQVIDTLKFNTRHWNVTSLADTWRYCQKLRKINLNAFDTSNWSVTDLARTWYNCWSLQELNLDLWDTSNWTVTSLDSTWYQCYSLQRLNINAWDTQQWVITTMFSTWYCCYSLQELNLNNWDTSNWVTTNVTGTWQSCWSLRKLKIDNWNTTNWKVQKLENTWMDCRSLKTLNLNNWDTSEWEVSTMYLCWDNNFQLEQLYISNWETKNWPLSSISNAWNGCNNLKVLNINTWDTSEWPLTSINSAWKDCKSLVTLDLSNWKTQNWVINSFSATWQNCYKLKQLNLNNWDTSNWAVTGFSTNWENCYSLQTLNIDEWDTSNWLVSQVHNVWNNCWSLKILDIEDWDISNWNITNNNNGNAINATYSLQICKLPSTVAGGTKPFNAIPNNSANIIYYSGHKYNTSFNLSNCPLLTAASLRSVINRLDTAASETTTLTLGAINKNKLTAEDLAIATNKGWTIA